MEQTWNDRNNKDSIRLWINDSLYFRGLYFTRFDSTFNNVGDRLGMQVARLHGSYKSNLKIRMLLSSLDSILFTNKSSVDTTFYYQLDKSTEIVISDSMRTGCFSIHDSIKEPELWAVEVLNYPDGTSHVFPM
jgi:hypothetical protein